MAAMFSPTNMFSYPFIREGNGDMLSPQRMMSPFNGSLSLAPVSPSTSSASSLTGAQPSASTAALMTPSSLLLLPSGVPFATLASPAHGTSPSTATTPTGGVNPQLYFSLLPRFNDAVSFGIPSAGFKEPYVFPVMSPKPTTSLISIAEAATEAVGDEEEARLAKLESSLHSSSEQKGQKKRATRPPPLSVAARALSAEPQVHLKLSASKLCKFRKYTMELTLKRSARLRADVTEAVIFAAMLNAKCCRDGSDVAVSCSRCSCQRVVNITATAQWPVYKEATDEETYSCTVQSKCSSSRDHLKSLLVLRIDSLPSALGEIVSEPFVLLARDKGKGKRELAAERALLLGETPKKRKKLSEEEASQTLRDLHDSPVSPPSQSCASLLSSLAKVGACAAEAEERRASISSNGSSSPIMPLTLSSLASASVSASASDSASTSTSTPVVRSVPPSASPSLLEALVASSHEEEEEEDSENDDEGEPDVEESVGSIATTPSGVVV